MKTSKRNVLYKLAGDQLDQQRKQAEGFARFVKDSEDKWKATLEQFEAALKKGGRKK
jgi:hypothetical protein